MTDVTTEWVVAKHVRFPYPWDTVVGRYPTEMDAQSALNGLLRNPQWFTNYWIEKRVSGG